MKLASAILHALVLRAAAVVGTASAELPLAPTPTGDDDKALGLPLATCPTIACVNTSATGADGAAVAFGYNTSASGNAATAMGEHNVASGNEATAMGRRTIASGNAATATGADTVANCGGDRDYGMCVAMGNGINATKPETVVASGDFYGKNYFFNNADTRLTANVTDADPAALLANVEKLRVVKRAPSKNYCHHQNRDPVECATDRAGSSRSRSRA